VREAYVMDQRGFHERRSWGRGLPAAGLVMLDGHGIAGELFENQPGKRIPRAHWRPEEPWQGRRRYPTACKVLVTLLKSLNDSSVVAC
jgi:hypothetical protein